MPGLLDAQDIPVVSQKEANLRQQTGSLADGSAAPSAMMVDSGTTTPPPGRLTAADLSPPPPAASPPGTDPDDFESAMGESSPKTLRESGLILKGLLKGGASIVTAPNDIAEAIKNHAMNWVREQFGYSPSKEEPSSGDLVNNGLTAAGFPQATGQQENALETAAGFAGGVLAGQAIPGGMSPSKLSYWRSAGPTSSVNSEVVNTLAAGKIGEQAKAVTPDVMNSASQRITGILDDVRGPDRIVMNHPDAVNSQIFAMAGEHTPTDSRLLKNDYIQRLSDEFNDGAANAQQLGNIASGLGREGSNKAATDWPLAQGLFEAKDYVEGLISEGLSGTEKAAYDEARQQYKWLVKYKEPGMVNRDTGQVNAVKLATDLESTDANGFSLGQNKEPLYSVLRQVQGSDGTSMPAIYHNKLAILMRAAARLGPGAAQYVAQRGLVPGLRAVVNHPGFMEGLGQELAGHADDGEEQQNGAQ